MALEAPSSGKTTTSPWDRVLVQRNNLVWLESWGCEVRQSDVVIVKNKSFAEYNAVLGIGPDLEAAQLLARVRQEFPPSAPAAIYIERRTDMGLLAEALQHSGYLPARRNDTYSLPLDLGTSREPPSIELVPVGEEQVEPWSRLYTESFGGGPEAERLNLERWTHCIRAAPAVRFYLLRAGGKDIGTVQFCVTGQVAGIYSFGIVPELRNRGYLGASSAAITRELRNLKFEIVYIERLRPLGPTTRSFAALEVGRRRGWRLLASAIGYQPAPVVTE